MWTAEIEQRLVTEWNERQRSALQIAVLFTDLFGAPFTRNAVIAKIWRMRRAGVSMRFSPNGPSRVLGAVVARRRRQKVRDAAKKARDLVLKPKEETRKASPPSKVVALDPGYPRIKSVEALEPEHCRWPFGDPGKPDFGFCGLTKIMGLPYCAAHSLRAYDANFLRSHPELRKFIPEKAEPEKIESEPELVA